METLDGPMNHYWEIRGICHSSFSRIISGSRSRGHAFRKSDNRCNLARRGVTISSTDRKIASTLFGRSESVDFLLRMGNVILNSNKTTWSNADTGLTPNGFYERGVNQQIAIRELGRM